jgi:hypothetical protein
MSYPELVELRKAVVSYQIASAGVGLSGGTDQRLTDTLHSLRESILQQRTDILYSIGADIDYDAPYTGPIDSSLLAFVRRELDKAAAGSEQTRSIATPQTAISATSTPEAPYYYASDLTGAAPTYTPSYDPIRRELAPATAPQHSFQSALDPFAHATTRETLLEAIMRQPRKPARQATPSIDELIAFASPAAARVLRKAFEAKIQKEQAATQPQPVPAAPVEGAIVAVTEPVVVPPVVPDEVLRLEERRGKGRGEEPREHDEKGEEQTREEESHQYSYDLPVAPPVHRTPPRVAYPTWQDIDRRALDYLHTDTGKQVPTTPEPSIEGEADPVSPWLIDAAPATQPTSTHTSPSDAADMFSGSAMDITMLEVVKPHKPPSFPKLPSIPSGRSSIISDYTDTSPSRDRGSMMSFDATATGEMQSSSVRDQQRKAAERIKQWKYKQQLEGAQREAEEKLKKGRLLQVKDSVRAAKHKTTAGRGGVPVAPLDDCASDSTGTGGSRAPTKSTAPAPAPAPGRQQHILQLVRQKANPSTASIPMPPDGDDLRRGSITSSCFPSQSEILGGFVVADGAEAMDGSLSSKSSASKHTVEAQGTTSVQLRLQAEAAIAEEARKRAIQRAAEHKAVLERREAKEREEAALKEAAKWQKRDSRISAFLHRQDVSKLDSSVLKPSANVSTTMAGGEKKPTRQQAVPKPKPADPVPGSNWRANISSMVDHDEFLAQQSIVVAPALVALKRGAKKQPVKKEPVAHDAWLDELYSIYVPEGQSIEAVSEAQAVRQKQQSPELLMFPHSVPSLPAAAPTPALPAPASAPVLAAIEECDVDASDGPLDGASSFVDLDGDFCAWLELPPQQPAAAAPSTRKADAGGTNGGVVAHADVLSNFASNAYVPPSQAMSPGTQQHAHGTTTTGTGNQKMDISMLLADISRYYDE